jgi:tetratricopeptide (TPR) repeat protein
MTRALAGALLSALLIATPALVRPAAAQNSGENAGKEASRHFQRGVDLYNEGDLRGALVEFRKAYRLLPRASVLYNIGQTEYQVQEYAQALRTLERFLSETGPNAAHRAEVQETVEVLKTRVGWIAVTSDQVDCDVSVDDQPAGSTPLGRSILVSIGRRKVALSCPGRPRASREFEVASGVTFMVELNVGAAAAAVAAAAGTADEPGVSRRSVITSLTITGALAAATAGVYTAAVIGSRQLERMRATYPVTAERLHNKATSNARLALVGDILAGATVVAVGVTTYLGLNVRKERGLEVGLSWDGLKLRGSF